MGVLQLHFRPLPEREELTSSQMKENVSYGSLPTREHRNGFLSVLLSVIMIKGSLTVRIGTEETAQW